MSDRTHPDGWLKDHDDVRCFRVWSGRLFIWFQPTYVREVVQELETYPGVELEAIDFAAQLAIFTLPDKENQ